MKYNAELNGSRYNCFNPGETRLKGAAAYFFNVYGIFAFVDSLKLLSLLCLDSGVLFFNF
jgi:hypothetical protein